MTNKMFNYFLGSTEEPQLEPKLSLSKCNKIPPSLMDSILDSGKNKDVHVLKLDELNRNKITTPNVEAISFDSNKPEWIPFKNLNELKNFSFVDNFGWPLGVIGRVFNISNKTFATGTLIGERTVLTASHIVPWEDRTKEMLFVPAYYNGNSLFAKNAKSYVTDVKTYKFNGKISGKDWAILRLEKPLGLAIGYMGFNNFSEDWKEKKIWSNVGYPNIRTFNWGEVPVYQTGISIQAVNGKNSNRTLESSDVQISKGNSGGPIFSWFNNGTDPRVVGVISGYHCFSETKQTTIISSSQDLLNLCAWGRNNWTK